MIGEYDPKYEQFYPFRVPLRKDMEDSDFFMQYPEFLVFIEGYQKPSINTPSETWVETYKDRYAHYMHEVIAGNMSIEDALEAIEE